MGKQHAADIQQSFSTTVPDAKNVMVVGNFTQWQEQPIHLKNESGGVWRTTVELPPGKYQYRFIVDGQWCDDPQCALWVANPYGSQDSVRLVPAV